jgi:hypothetical protein
MLIYFYLTKKSVHPDGATPIVFLCRADLLPDLVQPRVRVRG